MCASIDCENLIIPNQPFAKKYFLFVFFQFHPDVSPLFYYHLDILPMKQSFGPFRLFRYKSFQIRQFESNSSSPFSPPHFYHTNSIIFTSMSKRYVSRFNSAFRFTNRTKVKKQIELLPLVVLKMYSTIKLATKYFKQPNSVSLSSSHSHKQVSYMAMVKGLKITLYICPITYQDILYC